MIEVVQLTVALAHDFALETRIRRLLESHQQAGHRPRTLVMSSSTLGELINELDGRRYHSGYYWTPVVDGTSDLVPFFLGLPVLVKDYVAYGEVLVGV